MRDRVLITGGGAGIGAAIAERCKRDGLEPITIDLRNGDIEADLSDPAATSAAVAQALAGGPIHRLVNNVGVVATSRLEDATIDELDRSVRLNLQSSLLCAQRLLPGMKAAQFGRIVNISSRAALGKEDRTVYSATKAGLLGFTRTWALELAEHGITVNAVGPGPIRTELFDSANPRGTSKRDSIVGSIPVGRMGEPEDVAHSVAYFLDERSGFVTGQTLYVCGGKTVGLVSI